MADACRLRHEGAPEATTLARNQLNPPTDNKASDAMPVDRRDSFGKIPPSDGRDGNRVGYFSGSDLRLVSW